MSPTSYRSAIGPEACRGASRSEYWPGYPRPCFRIGRERVADDPNRRPAVDWAADAAQLQANAAGLDIEPDRLLCIGCERKRDRLITEGKWPQ